MKRVQLIVLCISYLSISYSQNVGIGTNSPNPSAQLDVSSTSKGFLPPRLTISQRDAIINPAIGLVVYCTDCDELEVYNGTTWKNMTGNAACVMPSLPSITICKQKWMSKNLDVDHYRDGSPIPQITDPSEWTNLKTGAWCWYNNDSATYAQTYGRLYNWYAVNDDRGLAPAGWHVPTFDEWNTLDVTCLGGGSYVGGKLKATNLWASPNTGATNSSGFSGIPGGILSVTGGFYGIGMIGFWWTATKWNNMEDTNSWYYYLEYNSATLRYEELQREYGFSVRCVAD